MEPLGTKIRRYRRRLGLTLDELAGRTGISKPYLSLIETGRVPNPPSDEKLRRLEQALGIPQGELLTQAHLLRTPRDVRVMLAGLMKQALPSDAATATAEPPVDLDDLHVSGVLRRLVQGASGGVEMLSCNAVPVINKVSAGYPRDFTDLSYPRGVADEYVSCPDLHDPDAFAARVHGDSMEPKYLAGDIVIFSPAVSARSGDDGFVLFDDGQTTFKRVFFETDELGHAVIRLQPRNEKYRPQMVPAEKITGVWRAVYRLQRVDGE